MDNAICWWTFCEMTESFKRDDGKRRAIKKKEVLAVKKKKTKKKSFFSDNFGDNLIRPV